MNLQEPLVFIAAKRTPFGAFGASLADQTATEMALSASKACVDQANIKPDAIDAIFIGNVVQSAADSIYLARHVGLKLGVPQDRPALLINRLCGSGFEAIVQGAYHLLHEGSSCVLVGGSESMSQVPYVLRQARFGQRLGHGVLEDFLTASLTDSYTGFPMAITTENLAEEYKISRADVDAYALLSQKRAAKAWSDGVYKDEVIALNLKRKGKDFLFDRDEHFRPDTTLEGLAKLSPLFKKDGTVTAGTASGICDGASMLLLCRESFAKKRGLKILGKLITWAAVGCDPKIMGIGPVPATRKVMENWSKLAGAKKTVHDCSWIEVNEAFAAQYLAVEKALELPRERTNVDGGAIAIGHPLAASGARLVSHLLYKLTSSKGGYGLASACIGGGQGMSVLIQAG